MESDIEALFSNNKKQLKKLFEALHPVDHKISIQEFLIFCKNVRIHPELLSINDIKKLVQDLSTKGISFGSMQGLLRLLAEQAFNSTPSVSDKLRMLFIHIRSPCKLFYQVSLNFNIQDSASEELEVDKLDFDKIKNLRGNETNKIIRNRFLNKSPDTVNFEKSPKSEILMNVAKLEERTHRLTDVDKSAAIKEKIERFNNSHNEIIKTCKTSNNSKKISMRRNYIYKLQETTFSKKLVLKVLFNAWKGLKGKLIDKYI